MELERLNRAMSHKKDSGKTGGRPAGMQRGFSNSAMSSVLGGDSVSAIRSRLEASSGVNLSDVSIHYNSRKPADIGALAYARGSDIFIGPGQERHIPHEMTHIVQQKQGLVQPTGHVGGMPVNTSKTLESAADNLSTRVPAGSRQGTAPAGGVVQGIFLSKAAGGGPVSNEDFNYIIKMLEGSYQSYIDRMDEIKKENKQLLKNAANEAGRIKNEMNGDERIRSAYKKARSTVGSRIKSKIKSPDEIYIEDFLREEIYNTHLKGYRDAMDHEGAISADVRILLNNSGKKVTEPQNRALDPEHTHIGFQREVAKFSINKEVFSGVDQIFDFRPEGYKAEALTSLRMSGSSSLEGDIGDRLEGRKASDKELNKRKSQFTKSAELSRKGAVAMRKKGAKIGFAFLYNLLSDLNRTVREGTGKGGNLRGAGVHVGNVISGVGQNQLPEDIYRLMNIIADDIVEIKGLSDEKLRKSQAIRLAAFSYQMLISIHPFIDGNARTCQLFSDAILQTFGLPPQLPLNMLISGTIGRGQNDQFYRGLDFEKGAFAFLYSVNKSSNALKQKQDVGTGKYFYDTIKDQKLSQKHLRYEPMTERQRRIEWQLFKDTAKDSKKQDLGYKEELAVNALMMEHNSKELEKIKKLNINKKESIKRNNINLEPEEYSSDEVNSIQDRRHAKRVSRVSGKKLQYLKKSGAGGNTLINNINNDSIDDSNSLINNINNDNIDDSKSLINNINNDNTDDKKIRKSGNRLEISDEIIIGPDPKEKKNRKPKKIILLRKFSDDSSDSGHANIVNENFIDNKISRKPSISSDSSSESSDEDMLRLAPKKQNPGKQKTNNNFFISNNNSFFNRNNLINNIDDDDNSVIGRKGMLDNSLIEDEEEDLKEIIFKDRKPTNKNKIIINNISSNKNKNIIINISSNKNRNIINNITSNKNNNIINNIALNNNIINNDINAAENAELSGKDKALRHEREEGLDFVPNKLGPRTEHGNVSKIRNNVARALGNTVSTGVFLPATLPGLIWSHFAKKGAEELFTSDDPEKKPANRTERRNHLKIPGWGGKEFRQEADGGTDILHDFRRVPTVWANPVPSPADEPIESRSGIRRLLPPKVTAYVKQPKPYSSASLHHKDPGHAFIGIEYSQFSRITGRNQRYRIKCGFYPARGYDRIPGTVIQGAGAIVPGYLKDDRDHSYDVSKTYTVTQKQAEKVAEAAEKYTELGGYGFFARNCVTFTRDMMKAGSLPADSINSLFKEETFRFNYGANAGFAIAGGFKSILNTKLLNKMRKYATTPDDSYQGEGNMRMTAEEYERYVKTNSQNNYGQTGWIPSSVAENMRRLQDGAEMTSYNYVSDEYKKNMAKRDVEGDASDLSPKTVEQFNWFFREPGKAGTALQNAIHRITTDEEIRRLDQKYNNFRYWYFSLPQTCENILNTLRDGISDGFQSKVAEWDEEHPNAANNRAERNARPTERSMDIWNCFTNERTLRDLYPHVTDAIANVNRHYTGALKSDARVHKEVMNLLSVLNMLLNLLEKGYRTLIQHEVPRGDLGNIREKAMKQEFRFNVGNGRELNFTPSMYEAYLQLYGTPQQVGENVVRYIELKNSWIQKHFPSHAYSRFERDNLRALDYDSAHRYLLDKDKYSASDLDYIFDLWKKERAGMRLPDVSDNMMSGIYGAIMFDKLFSGLKKAVEDDKKVPESVNSSNIGTLVTCVDSFLNDRLKSRENRAGMKAIIEGIERAYHGEADTNERQERIFEVFESVFLDGYLRNVFPTVDKDEKSKLDSVGDVIDTLWGELSDRTFLTAVRDLINEVVLENR